MDARAEAEQRLGGRYEVRVLEPSPPASHDPPYFADDPVARGEGSSGRPVVSPVATGDLLWIDLAGEDEALAAWCAERWLGPYPRLGPVPDQLATTRVALHRLAERVIAPARQAANGKIGLRYTRGGFGTPFFGANLQIRVSGRELIVQDADVENPAPISTLAAAAAHVGLIGADELDDDPLRVDAAASVFLGDWYGFSTSVLEQLRAGLGADADPSRVQLWPEHFDLAVELGAESAGARAAYGASPGDEAHPEPYLYVAPWEAPEAGPLWQATGFGGAELPYSTLLAATDQRAVALTFFEERLVALGP